MIFGGTAPPGLCIIEQIIRPGLVAAVMEGGLKAPAEIPFKGRHACVAICFFSDKAGHKSCRRTTSRAPDPLGADHRASRILIGALHRSGGRLSLNPAQSVRMLFIGLHPQMVFSLLGTAPGQVPAVLAPALRATAEKRSMMTPLSILDCPAAMKACIERLYQSLLNDSGPKLARESMVLELLYRLMDFSSPSHKDTSFLSGRDLERLYLARCILDADLSNPPGLAELTRRCGLSKRRLERGFKALFTNTVYGYVTEQRMEAAREMLAQDSMNVNQAGQALGYQNVSHFIAAFRKHFGITPGCYQRDLRMLTASPGSRASRKAEIRFPLDAA